MPNALELTFYYKSGSYAKCHKERGADSADFDACFAGSKDMTTNFCNSI